MRLRPRARLAVALAVAVPVLLGGCLPLTIPAHPLAWGVYVPDDGSPSSDLGTVAAMAGRRPDYVLNFAALPEQVPIGQLASVADSGATPILTLEPWAPGAGVDQPAYSLAAIAAGRQDHDLLRWAHELAAWGGPLLLRFAHEPNGTWYPWSIGVNGNSAADYLGAWSHMHDAFKRAGADEVSFVWSVNVPTQGSPDIATAFPGPDTVDYLGLDGYNWGGGDGHAWQQPSDLFQAGLTQLRSLPGGRHILITELASADDPQSASHKETWIRACVTYLSSSERVEGFVWFQAAKERDWRFNSTAQAQAAMKESLAQLPR